MFDSTVRLKQINNAELSGYILNVVEGYLTSEETGILTGLFYPLTGNPSGFITTGQTGIFITSVESQIAINSSVAQTLSYIAANYLDDSQSGLFVSTGQTGSLNFITPVQSGTLTGTFAQLHGANLFNNTNQFNSGITIGGNLTSINFSNPNSGIGHFNYIKDANGYSVLQIGLLDAFGQKLPFRIFYDDSGTQAISFTSGLRYLYDATGGNPSVDFGNRILSGDWTIQDSNANNLIDTNHRLLKDTSAKTTLDFSNLLLTGGIWTAQGLQIQGSNVITSNQSGSFYSNSNPSGFITGINTGALTGQFYPLSGNPAGYITGFSGGTILQVTGSGPLTTGNFSGVSGITVTLSGNYILINGGGGITTGSLTGVTGIFAILNSGNIFTATNTFSGNVVVTDTNAIYFTNTLIQNGNLSNLSGMVIDFQNAQLVTPANGLSVDWANQNLISNTNVLPSLNWNQYATYDSSYVKSIDWNNRKLFGGWATTGGLTISGKLTYNGTGQSVGSSPINTGIPVSWMPITVTGVNYYIPLYQ